MDNIIVGTQSSSRYTFHPIFPRWLGSGLSLFSKEFPRIHPITALFKLLKNIIHYTPFFKNTLFLKKNFYSL